ncbi:uncharacterized protein LOC119563984 [Chelonia mydas]|uniref:uncharacterized protein LOC119563984 n=1 Tax=Chelonia mydas TaxID=8469 RepID=UPI0018A2250B|nr:uncharacterized protein LOC119563984 [Chelonia mydas]
MHDGGSGLPQMAGGPGEGPHGAPTVHMHRLGPVGKQHQIHVSPGPKHRVYQGAPGRSVGHSHSPTRRIQEPERSHRLGLKVPSGNSQGLPAALGSHVGVHVWSPSRQTQGEATPTLVGLEVLPGHRQDGQGPVPDSVITSLQWWSAPNNMLQEVLFRDRALSLELVSDVSDLGWEAHVGNFQTQGLWSAQDLTLHINIKELRTVQLVCMAFRSHLEGKVVKVLMDNMALMFYINREGGAQSSALCHEALRLWDFCIAHDIHLKAFYLPGSQNERVDCLNRDFALQHEWSLHPEVAHRLFRRWGTPQVDLLVTRQNRRCPRFCSKGGLGRGAISDAFILSWSGQLLHAFPPHSL